MFQLPRIKRFHNPYRLPGNRIIIGTRQRGVGGEIEDDSEGTIWSLLQLMDGTRTEQGIVEELVRRRPDIDGESIQGAIAMIVENGYVEEAAAAPPPEFSPEELERYSRNNNYFSWVDTAPRQSPYELQLRLKRSRVCILGLGGSGSPVALSLAAVGVGSILCVDCDVVERSNLNRQLLYQEDDIGKSKVAVAVERLQRMNSHIKVTGLELRVNTADDLLPLMNDADLLMLCADTPRDRIQHIVNEAALRTKKPWIISAYAGPMLVVGTYLPFTTPCAVCAQHQYEKEELELGLKPDAVLYDNPSIQAVIAPTSALTGSLGALEAVYLLTGLKPNTAGRIYHLNMMDYDQHYYVQWPFWDQCPACGPDSPWRPKG
jgi:molybdopterin/thiamine biosynthesis adenylyltransferase